MATGRDEMLRRNQQRNKKRKAEKAKSSVPKRKGLMEVLDDYRAEQESGPYAPERNKNVQGPVRSGKAYGKFLEDNIKKARSKPPLVLAPKPETKEKPPADPVKPKFPNEQANKDKEGNLTGTYGAGRPTDKNPKPKPTERSGKPKPKRSDFPAGRSGDQRYNRALNAWKNSLSIKIKVKRDRRGRVVK